MNKENRGFFIKNLISISLFIFLSIFLLRCSRSSQDAKSNVPLSIPSVTPTVRPEATAMEIKENMPAHRVEKHAEKIEKKVEQSLAALKRLKPSVDLRKKGESIWESAHEGIALNRHDAIQTRQNAEAQVVFKSGAELEVAESTLIILDHDPKELKEEKEDRVIIQDGSLVGKTHTELWLFSGGNLIQLKGNSKEPKSAEIKVVVQKGKKLNVVLESGSGVIINSNHEMNGKPEKFEIAKKREVILPLSTVEPSEVLDWGKTLSEVKSSAPLNLASLHFTAPTEGSIVSGETVTIQGAVTGSGTRVLINGKEAELDSNLHFSLQASLNEGANVLVAQLIRPDGSVAYQRMTLIRKDQNK